MKKSIFFAGLCTLFFSSNVFAEEHVIRVVSDYDKMEMTFKPKNLRIKPGDTVTWVNEADESHNMMTYPDGYPKGGEGFASPYLEKAGDKWSHTFDKAEGVYEYHCVPHIMMGMRGKVTVGEKLDKIVMHEPSLTEVKAYRDTLLEFFDEEDFEHMPEYVSTKLFKKKK